MSQDTDANHQPHHGGCYCGGVKFRIDGPLFPALHCHCGQCRRMTGFHMAATGALEADVTFETDEGLTWFRSSDVAQRGFCGTCGSPLFWQAFGSKYLSITMGALDDPDRIEAKAHIYVADKPNWYQLCDGLPQYDGDMPAVAAARDELAKKNAEAGTDT